MITTQDKINFIKEALFFMIHTRPFDSLLKKYQYFITDKNFILDLENILSTDNRFTKGDIALFFCFLFYLILDDVNSNISDKFCISLYAQLINSKKLMNLLFSVKTDLPQLTTFNFKTNSFLKKLSVIFKNSYLHTQLKSKKLLLNESFWFKFYINPISRLLFITHTKQHLISLIKLLFSLTKTNEERFLFSEIIFIVLCENTFTFRDEEFLKFVDYFKIDLSIPINVINLENIIVLIDYIIDDWNIKNHKSTKNLITFKTITEEESIVILTLIFSLLKQKKNFKYNNKKYIMSSIALTLLNKYRKFLNLFNLEYLAWSNPENYQNKSKTSSNSLINLKSKFFLQQLKEILADDISKKKAEYLLFKLIKNSSFDKILIFLKFSNFNISNKIGEMIIQQIVNYFEQSNITMNVNITATCFLPPSDIVAFLYYKNINDITLNDLDYMISSESGPFLCLLLLRLLPYSISEFNLSKLTILKLKTVIFDELKHSDKDDPYTKELNDIIKQFILPNYSEFLINSMLEED